MKNRHSRFDMFVIGFALFSMFFGAGNVIFPPFLGTGSGSQWGLGFACYYLADIGLALVALFSIFHRGSAEKIMEPVGRVPATLLMCAIVLCIGPMLAIPRTAATTLEMSVTPLLGSTNSWVFAAVFFAVVFVCAVRENSVVDIVGKLLTPMLLIGLLILIVKGVLDPLGATDTAPQIESVAAEGIKAGYQTMDVLATMLFGVIILKSAESKGYTEHAEKRSIAINASLVAGAILLVVYGGLTYLGATVSSTYNMSMGRTSLVLALVEGLLGRAGTIIFAIVVALACLTTAVGLVSACAEYFSNLSNGRLSYVGLVTAICVFSAVVSNVGLDQLIGIAAPVLDVVYPPTLVLVAMSFIPGISKLSIRFATVAALIVSTLGAVATYAQVDFLSATLSYLPMSALGFGWVIPAVVFALIGFAIKHSDEPKA